MRDSSPPVHVQTARRRVAAGAGALACVVTLLLPAQAAEVRLVEQAPADIRPVAPGVMAV